MRRLEDKGGFEKSAIETRVSLRDRFGKSIVAAIRQKLVGSRVVAAADRIVTEKVASQIFGTEGSMDLETRRRNQAKAFSLKLALWVGLPTLIATFYYGLIASDYYQSESKFTIQSSEGTAGITLDSFLGTTQGTSSDRDALALNKYILSRDVLSRLEKDHQFSSHYKNTDIDWWSRLKADATFEESYDYYLTKVEVTYDTDAGVSTLTVRALNAEKAGVFANAIIGYAEETVNRLSDRAQFDRMAFARREVEDGEKRLTRARSAILSLQREGEDINPTESASAIFSIRNELQAELVKAKTEYRELVAYMRPENHRVVALKQRIQSLEEQIDNENLRLIDSKEQSLSASIARFEPLLLEKEFSEKAYESALTSLEVARIEAAQKHQYLATIVSPSIPDEPTHPERVLGIVTVFLISFTAFGIGSLLIAAVREHARI